MSYAPDPQPPTLELPIAAPLWLDSPTTTRAVPGRHRNGRWPGQRRPAVVEVDAAWQAGQFAPVPAYRGRGGGFR